MGTAGDSERRTAIAAAGWPTKQNASERDLPYVRFFFIPPVVLRPLVSGKTPYCTKIVREAEGEIHRWPSESHTNHEVVFGNFQSSNVESNKFYPKTCSKQARKSSLPFKHFLFLLAVVVFIWVETASGHHAVGRGQLPWSLHKASQAQGGQPNELKIADSRLFHTFSVK